MLKIMKAVAAIFALVIFEGYAGLPTGSGDMEIARSGKALVRIVRPVNPIPAETRAVKELADYLTKATGASFEIIDEKDVSAQTCAIYVGPTAFAKKQGIEIEKLGKEESIVRTVGGNLIIAGGRPRGTLYGVYTFLEDALGIRWYTPWCEKVPARAECRVKELNLQRKPSFDMRDVYYWCYEPRFKPGDEGYDWWIFRNRMNGLSVGRGEWFSAPYENTKRLREETGGGWVLAGPNGHTFCYYFPPEEYYDKHPEWYSMRKGVRVNSGKRFGTSGNHLCLTNKELQAAFKEKLLQKLREIPFGDTVGVGMNDGGISTFCDCQECSSFVKKNGNGADLLMHMITPMADAIGKEFPDKWINTLVGYGAASEAPKTIKIPDNVIPHVATMPLTSFVYYPDLKNNRWYKVLENWCEKSRNHLWVWEKSTAIAYGIGCLRPIWWQMDENVKMLKQMGVSGIFAEDEWALGCTIIDEFYEMKCWLYAKLMSNSDSSLDNLMQDFLQGYYGEAGPYLFDYIMLQKARRPLWPWRFVDYGYIHKAHALFDQAEKAVADKPELLARVRDSRIQLDVTTLAWHNKLINDYLQSGGADKDYPYRRARIRDRLLNTLNSTTNPLWRKGGGWVWEQSRKPTELRCELAKEYVNLLSKGEEYNPLPKELRKYPPEQVIEIPILANDMRAYFLVEDPEACNGMAIKAPGDNFPFEFSVYDHNSEYHVTELNLLSQQDVKGEGYHLYRGKRFKMGLMSFLYLSSSWGIQFWLHTLYDPLKPDQLWDYYFSAKFTGKNKGEACIDRVFLVPANEGDEKNYLRLYTLLARWPLDGDGAEWAPPGTGESNAKIDGGTWVAGRFGKALAFTNQSDVAIVPFDDKGRTTLRQRLNFSDKSFTISMFFRSESTQKGQVLIEQFENTEHFYVLSVEGPKTLIFGTFDAKNGRKQEVAIDAVAGNLADGKWHHIVAGYDRDKKLMFARLDEKEYKEAPLDAFPQIEAPIRIGSGRSGFFQGAVDEVQVYGQADSMITGGKLAEK